MNFNHSKPIHIICIFLVTIFCWSSYCAPIKVFILSGQSNMVGFGKVSDFCTTCPMKSTIAQNTFPNIAWYVALDNAAKVSFLDPLKPVNAFKYDSFYTFGPEIGIAKQLSLKFPNEQLIFIKVAWGGTDLQNNWLLNVSDHLCDQNGVYSWFINRVSDAITDIKSRSKFARSGYVISGMIWLQGESDGLDSSYAQAYANNLASFVNKIRTDPTLKALNLPPKLPFVYGKIQNAGLKNLSRRWIPFGLNVQVGQYHAQTIDCVRCTDGSANAAATVWDYEGSDTRYNKWHYDSQGVYNVGLALGQAMVDLFNGKTTPWGCSNPASKAWMVNLLRD